MPRYRSAGQKKDARQDKVGGTFLNSLDASC